jgi:Zn-dependent protease
MFGTGSRFQIAKVRGIPIYASWSWVALAAFFTFAWYSNFAMSMTSSDAFRLAGITAVLFFGGILLHEAAHAIAARSFDLPVRAITLVFWGGATETRSWRAGPLADFVVAAAGPGTTAVLGLGFLYIASIMPPGDTSEAIRSLGGLNLYFAVLNAVPGFPLDGGRMLQAAAWGVTKNRGTAMKVAGFGSMVIGVGLLAYAVYSFAQGNGGFGIFMGYLGFVLIGVGRQVPARAALYQQLSRGKVRDAMRPLGAAIPANATVFDATERWLRADPARTFSVVEDGHAVGTISLEDASHTTAGRPVREAMVPFSDRSAVGADEVLSDALEWVAGHESLVEDATGTVGVIDVGDMDRWMKAHWSTGSYVERPVGFVPQAGVVPPRPDV